MKLAREKAKYSEKTLLQCHFIRQKSHVDWFWMESWLPWSEAGG